MIKYIHAVLWLVILSQPISLFAQSAQPAQSTQELSPKQQRIKNIAEQVGKKVCSSKPKQVCFGKTLSAIVKTESTYGLNYSTKVKNSKSSLGPFQIKISTAQEVIQKSELSEYKYLLNNRFLLKEKLIHDHEFGALIASHYLMMNYNIAVEKHHRNPWRFAVSRYNGGSNNYSYISKIQNNL